MGLQRVEAACTLALELGTGHHGHVRRILSNATVADAILDRLLSRSHRPVLKGESLRPRKAAGPALATASDVETSATTGKTR